MTTGITTQQARTLVWELKDDEKVTKGHVKNLSKDDRKILYSAIIVIEKVKKVSALNQKEPDEKKIPNKKITDLSERLTCELKPPPKPIKQKWYKRPYLWAARLIHKIWLGFCNIFLGRMSTTKLWNKIATFRNEIRKGEKKYIALTQDRSKGHLSKINKAKREIEKKIEQRKKTLDKLEEMLACRNTLNKIWVKKAKYSSIKQFKGLATVGGKLRKGYEKEIHDKRFEVSDYKGAAQKVLTKCSEFVKDYFKNLVAVVTDKKSSIDRCLEEYEQARKKVDRELQKLGQVIKQDRDKLNEALKLRIKREKKAELYKLKYNL